MTSPIELNKCQEISTECTIDESMNRTYVKTLHVMTERNRPPIFGYGTSSSVQNLDDFGSPYKWFGFTDQWAFSNNYQIKRKSEITDPSSGDIRTLWTITITYDSKPTNNQKQQSPREDPTTEEPICRGGFQMFKRGVWRDRKDDPIVNAFGDPYDPPAEIDSALDTVSISVNTKKINLVQRANAIGKVNSNTMWGLEKRRVKLTQWNWQKLWAGKNFPYVKNDFEFEISFVEHPKTYVAKGPKGVKGYYKTLPNSGERYWIEPPTGELDPCSEVQYGETNRVERNIGKFAVNDEVQSTRGKLEKDGTERKACLPDLYNVFELEHEFDFSKIDRLPTVSLPVP